MTSHLCDGVVVPDRVAGHLALELCNTRAGWGTENPREYLVDHRALLAWGLDNGLLTGPLPPPAPTSAPAPRHTQDPIDLALVLRLRELAHPILTGSRDPGLFTRLTAVMLAARAGAVLVPDGPRPARWRAGPADARLTSEAAATDAAATQATAGAAVALAAGLAVEALLTSPTVADVGECAGPGCGWVFLDPRHRRRWCSMAVCGNRAKARRHSRRRPD